MATKGNQYATRAFSEHPIALWPLDEQTYYLSQIDNNDRLFSNWTGSGFSTSNSPTLPSELSPFEDDIYSSFTKSTSAAGTIDVQSPNLFSLIDVSNSISTFTVNFFLYQKPDFINWFKVGYRYLDAGASPQEVISAAIPPPSSSSWINFNNTYDIPTSWSGSLQIFIQVNFADSSAGDATSRTIIMNGLSVGQGSELTCYESLGLTDIAIPAELGLTGMTGVPADQYGVLADNGYYLVRNNALLAKNDGMPLVYGTDNSTIIETNIGGLPSFVFPGKNMLHEKGRNKIFTLESWIKIDPRTSTALRILGPLDSTDGLYVKEGFISLAIGSNVSSHFVSDWYRPMLVHIIIRDTSASLLINGEQVATVLLDRSTLDLPDTNDWWAVYSYDTIDYFAIDSISIYPYIMSESSAKRRFVYGQGTPNIQSIDNAYQGVPTTIDFATAEYDASIIYPDIARWDAGYFNNLNATRDYLSIPNYQLPNINIGGRDVDQWYADNLIVNDYEDPTGTSPKFVSFRPNAGTRTNLVQNPSFETGVTTYWGKRAQATIFPYVDGSRNCMRMQFDSASSVYAYPTGANIQNVSAAEGDVIRFSADVKNISGKTVTMGIAPIFQNSVPAAITSANVVQVVLTGTDTGWVTIEGYLIAPATTASLGTIRINANIPTYVAGDSVLIDNFCVTYNSDSPRTDYFDGNIEGASWSGTAELSESTIPAWAPLGNNYTAPSYLNFPTLNVLNDQISAVYGVVQVDNDIATDRTLMSFVNVTNGNTFDIVVNSDEINYSFNGGTPLHTEIFTIGEKIALGVNFQNVSSAFGYEVARFFSSPSSIQLFIGGNGINTFEGKIFTIGLANQTNYSQIDTNFDANGIALGGNYYAVLLDHYASYTLFPEYEYGRFFLDISVASSWEDYFPLSYFASYVKDENGNNVYDVDMLQVNIGYPTVISTIIWSVAEFQAQFAAQTYADLAASEYLTYFSLEQNNTTGGAVSAAGSSLQSYLTFQPLAQNANKPLESFAYTAALPPDSVIYADRENTVYLPTKAYLTSFPFKDNVVVYPPKDDFENYCMVVHLQISQRSILNNPLRLKSLEVSAKNTNYNSLSGDRSQRTYLGTKFGKKVYPSVNIFNIPDYKSQNPIKIYKTSTPYLYAQKKGGINVVNESLANDQSLAESNVFIPINESGAFDYKVAAMQFMVRADFMDDSQSIKMVEVRHKNGSILYALDKIGGMASVSSYERAGGTDTLIDGGAPATASYVNDFDYGLPDSIFPQVPYLDLQNGAANGATLSQGSWTALSGTDFYQNGRFVQSPVLNNNEWNVIGLVFPDQLDFGEYQDGGIVLYGGAVFNNISYYLAEGLGTKTDITTRTWQGVFDQDGAVPAGTTWAYWDGSSWQSVYLLGSASSYISNPADIYSAYMGTNSEIVDDGMGLSLNHRQAQIVSSGTWSVFSDKPA